MSTPAIPTPAPTPAAPAPAPTAPTEPAGATPAATEPLGAAGIAALKAERDARAAAEKATADALAKVKEYEDRDKTDQQKQQDALDAAKRELAEVTVAKTRAEVAAATGVPAALLKGGTEEELKASAAALIAFRGTQTPSGLHIPNEGNSPAVTQSADDWLRGLAQH